MKTIVLMVCLFISGYSYAQNIPLSPQQPNNTTPTPNFSSAEERMVFNKIHQLPKYEGIEVEYVYQLRELPPDQQAKDLIAHVKAQFLQVLEVDYQQRSNQLYLCIRTNGSKMNHDIYNQLLDKNNRWFARHNRQYFLK